MGFAFFPQVTPAWELLVLYTRHLIAYHERILGKCFQDSHKEEIFKLLVDTSIIGLQGTVSDEPNDCF